MINHIKIIVHFAQLISPLLRASSQLEREVREISLNYLTFTMDRPSAVRKIKLSFVRRSRDLIVLSESLNIQIIVDHGAREGRD